jgi:putative nucleotidyltransferase with HDIG domain
VIGHDLGSARQPGPLEEHLFAVVQETADLGAELSVRLCALLHDLGKPDADRTGATDHARVGARLAAGVMRRLRYPNALRDEVCRLVASHAFWLDPPIDGLYARRFLASHGYDRARRLLLHKRADLHAKHVEECELENLALLERLLEEPVTAAPAADRRWTATTCSNSGTARARCSALRPAPRP